MNKKELRDGDRVTFKNGEIDFYNNLGFLYKEFGWYNDDLTRLEKGDNQLDIVKVERIEVCIGDYLNMMAKNYSFSKEEICYLNSNLKYRTIWEREEEAEEMTMTELCKELGRKVKIVEEK